MKSRYVSSSSILLLFVFLIFFTKKFGIKLFSLSLLLLIQIDVILRENVIF